MISDDASCSECKLELIQKRWTQLLMNWLNNCVHPKTESRYLNARSLVEVIIRYKDDICANDKDRAILCTDDLEPFLRYKYPILRLRYYTEEKDLPKKLYVMTTVLMYHCCVNSLEGVVVADICQKLARDEQEMILVFCERLNEMEITINNVESAIKQACEAVSKVEKSLGKRKKSKKDIEQSLKTSIKRESRVSNLKFKSSVSVLPSYVVVTDASSFSKTSLQPDSSLSTSDGSSKLIENYDKILLSDSNDVDNIAIYNNQIINLSDVERKEIKYEVKGLTKDKMDNRDSEEIESPYKKECACARSSITGPCCGDAGTSALCDDEKKDSYKDEKKEVKKMTEKENLVHQHNWRLYAILLSLVVVSVLVVVGFSYLLMKPAEESSKSKNVSNMRRLIDEVSTYHPSWAWECKQNVCQKNYQPKVNTNTFYSLSRCTIECMGPQVWPHPIGYTSYSKSFVALETNKLEYKLQSVPSDIVHQYLAEAFKLFLEDLVMLERVDMKSKHNNQDLDIKRMYIQIDVESDPDPRLRLNTDESYYIKIDTVGKQIKINILSASFCGVRHGLETLSQLILLDQSTGTLITVSEATIKDAPSYKYRGLMIDTGRNYIPVPDLLRTIDAMATCKLNTFHWRISDATSFPLLLPKLSNLFEFGAYDRTMVYTKDDVRTIVNRAGIRGIRVLIEVTAPGPVGRAWSWSEGSSCPKKNDNFTCDNILCVRLKMQESVYDLLQYIYSEIIDLTSLDDIFHLSNSLFSYSNCYHLLEEREGFLEKALERLRLANKGFLPKLPIVWYTTLLLRDFEAKAWERFGVQLYKWLPDDSDQSLSKFRLIHSSKWDLSCKMKKQRCVKYSSWQEMYSWKTWRSLDVFSIEGGEAVLWTDLVDSGNLDYHLWPRAAAVAERLWSDLVANTTPGSEVYMRLDTHRWRMLLRGVKAQPIWPVWCSFNPLACISKLRQ